MFALSRESQRLKDPENKQQEMLDGLSIDRWVPNPPAGVVSADVVEICSSWGRKWDKALTKDAPAAAKIYHIYMGIYPNYRHQSFNPRTATGGSSFR
jgi:hypothetical protein